MDAGFKAAKEAEFAQVNEAIQCRVRAATAWSVLLLVTSYPLFNAAVTFNPFDLGQWLYDFSLANVSFSTLYALAWLSCLLVLANYSFVQLRTVQPLAVRTRVQSLALLHQQRLPLQRLLITSPAVVVLACGAFAPAALVGPGTAAAVQRYASWRAPCEDGASEDSNRERWCLNEFRCILFIYGMVVGAVYSVRLLMGQTNCLVFPILQQPKFFRCKAQLWDCVWTAAQLAWGVLRYTYVVFFLLGILFNGWLASLMLLNSSSSTGPLTSVWALLSPLVVWHLLVTGTLIVYCLEASRTVLHVYLTERYYFPVDSDLETDKSLTLVQGLMAEQNPYVQYLAFLDLSYLAKHDRARRSEIFTLSQPGGHPHRWRRVCFAALATVTSLTARLRQHVSPPPPAASAAASLLKTGSASKDGTAAVSGAPTTQAAQGLVQRRLALLRDRMVQALGLVSKHRLVSYFTTDLSDGVFGQLFSDSQKLIWAIDGLSGLAIASYAEDEYGAVQGSLKDIIAALLDLQEVLERFVKASPGLLRRPPSEQFNFRSLELLLKLRVTVRAAIHRLAEVFGQQASFLSLSGDHQAKLRTFAEYRE